MLTVGVLGAGGFVGSRIVEQFYLGGTAHVVPIVRGYGALPRPARFALETRLADALDYAALVKAFAGCDIVVNAVLGPYNQIVAEPPIIYKAAEAAGVRRLIHISTASVHGQAPEPGTDETSALRTDQPFPYNNAKVRAEQQFRALRKRGLVELVMLRPGIVFGPRDIWISGIARQLAQGRAYLVDGGRGICNTVYIDNLVHAVRLALEAPVDGEVFLIGDSEIITWAEIHRWVAAGLGSCAPPRILDDPPIAPAGRPWLDRMRGIALWKATMRQVPAAAKDRGREMLALLKGAAAGMREARQRRTRGDWVLPDDSIGPVPLETAMLHRCRYKFPFAKARRMLGYEPVVSVEDGLIRSIRSLALAGYTIDPDFYLKIARTRPQPSRRREIAEPEAVLQEPPAVSAA
ncbi:MAG TPA: NAD(P)-dependent oxidoreductase [Alphaproteobacteria bacterium]|nr:NAD(P)-dependent oxidoreductase [Alphaproteobacteria bacterium]